MVALTIQVDQGGPEVDRDLGEDRSECLDGFAIQAAPAVLAHEDQMDVHRGHTVPTVSKILVFLHGPEYNAAMERRQAFKFALRPNGEQQRQMSRFAGCARYVYNKALALKKEQYQKKEKVSRFALDKMLVEWKQETPWLAEAPAHALQQAILDLDRAYTNFFEKRAQFPKFRKKGLRDSFRESDAKCVKLDQANHRMQLPKLWLGTLSQQPGSSWSDSQRHGQLVGGQVVRQYQHVTRGRAAAAPCDFDRRARLGSGPFLYLVER
jgi:hypothetical protein